MLAGPRKSLQCGLTLVELAVAVVVVVIVAAIAIPAYRHHVLQVKSVDATRELQALVLRLEACRRRTGSYAHMDDQKNACLVLPYSIRERTYRISGEISADAFLLTATPQGSQADDVRCGAFTVDHNGQQGVTGRSSPRECWQESRR